MTILAPLMSWSSPASADAPTIEGSETRCDWDEYAGAYYWWVDAYAHDADADATWAEVLVLDRDDDVVLWDYMWLVHSGGTWSAWYYDFYEFAGGPRCTGTYRVVVNVYDATEDVGTVSYLVRQL